MRVVQILSVGDRVEPRVQIAISRAREPSQRLLDLVGLALGLVLFSVMMSGLYAMTKSPTFGTSGIQAFDPYEFPDDE